MAKAINIVTAIFTLILCLLSIVFAIVGIVKTMWLLSVVCVIFAAIFGYFSWTDYQKLMINKRE